MKKLFSFLLVLAMVFSLAVTTAVTSFAETDEDGAAIPEAADISGTADAESAAEAEEADPAGDEQAAEEAAAEEGDEASEAVDIDGADESISATWVKGSGKDLVVDYNGTEKVELLRVQDSAGNYSITDFETVEGKPILKAEWLETLSVGSHTIWLKDAANTKGNNYGTLTLTIEEGSGDDPGDDPGTDPGTDPGGDQPGGDFPGGDFPGGDFPGGDFPGFGPSVTVEYIIGSGDLVLADYEGDPVDHIDCDNGYSGQAEFYNNDDGKPVLKEEWLLGLYNGGSAGCNLWVKDAASNQVMMVLTIKAPELPPVVQAAQLLTGGQAADLQSALNLLKYAVGILELDPGTDPGPGPGGDDPGTGTDPLPEVESGRNIAEATTDGTTVDIHTDIQETYLEAARAGTYKVPETITTGGKTYNINQQVDYSRPAPVVLSWDGDDSESYYVELASDPDFSNVMCTYSVTEATSVEVYNLFTGTEYYWRVAPSETQISDSDVYSFTTSSDGPRSILIDGVTNVRDLGGYELEDGTGTVRQGMIYRSGRLNISKSNEDKWRFADNEDFFQLTITEDGIDTLLNELGVKTELDIRSNLNNEVGNMNVDRIPGLGYVCCSMEYAGGSGNNITRTGKTSDGQAFSNPESIKAIFELLADESNYPVIFHCNIGTDRTGCIAFLIDALCGVSKHDILVDYAYSAFGYQTANRGITAINDYINTVSKYAGDTLAEKTENALIEICGLDHETLQSVRDIMIEYD